MVKESIRDVYGDDLLRAREGDCLRHSDYFSRCFLCFLLTVGGIGGQSGPITASKSTDPAKDNAAERRRWSERVERDNQLDPSGSAPCSYGTFGPRFTW